MTCTMLSLSKLCARLGELCGKAPDKREATHNNREVPHVLEACHRPMQGITYSCHVCMP